MKITLDLTAREAELLRNCTSDLGRTDLACVTLQLKIADAILDVTPPPCPFDVNQTVRVTVRYTNGEKSGYLATIQSLVPLVVVDGMGVKHTPAIGDISPQ